MRKYYCFTLDDNIRFLEEAVKGGLTSVFQTPYLQMLRRLHDDFGCKVQLNMFYSYEPGGFSLADCPDCYRSEFELNSDWLRLSFHARHNDPEFPYENKDEVLQRDYMDVMRELYRISGPKALGTTTTLHYVSASRKGCRRLRELGVRGLVGMFYDLSSRNALRYYLTPEASSVLRRENLWFDSETDLYFARNQMIINQIVMEDLPARLENMEKEKPEFFQFMIHEQYFYSDYPYFQPDFESKLRIVLSWCREKEYTTCFLEELCR